MSPLIGLEPGAIFVPDSVYLDLIRYGFIFITYYSTHMKCSEKWQSPLHWLRPVANAGGGVWFGIFTKSDYPWLGRNASRFLVLLVPQVTYLESEILLNWFNPFISITGGLRVFTKEMDYLFFNNDRQWYGNSIEKMYILYHRSILFTYLS